MALSPIVTDGTETGSTAATKINAGFTQTDANTIAINANTAGISTNTTNISGLDTRVTTNEGAITALDDRITVVEPLVTANTDAIVLLDDRITVVEPLVTANTDAITALDTRVTTNETNIATNTADIATNVTSISDIDTRLTTLEGNTNTAVVIKGVNPPLQTLVSNTPTKLQWMETVIVDAGNTDITYNIGNNEFYVNDTAVYKLRGTVTFVAPNNDKITLELYIDNVPTGFRQILEGRGNSQTITAVWASTETFTAGDEVSIYATSSGTEINLTYANVSLEKTPF